jgi:hypothetical protein
MWNRKPDTVGPQEDLGLAPTVRNPCRRCPTSPNRRASASRPPRRATIGPLGLFMLALPLGAQSLQILPAPSPDSPNTFRIMIVSPPENPVLALQWRVAVSKGAVIPADGIQPGAAAAAARKELTCRAVESVGQDASAYVCILAGGRQPIPDGPVAMVRLLAQDRDSSVTVRLSGMKAVTIDTKAKIIPDIEAVVPVLTKREKK